MISFCLYWSLALAGIATAQNASYYANSTVPLSTTAAGGSRVADPSAFVTSLDVSVEDLWDLFVGPVETAIITTTAEPTPIPEVSLVPPPQLNSFVFPAGRQVPLTTKNESWSFPSNFIFGVSSASFQVEGAANAEGKGPSVWDVATHRITNFVADNATGDITDNHYYLYKQDIARMAAIGVRHFSFSIAWSRIMPFGSGAVNQLAIDHYNDVINTCIHYNITPMITLFHWDLPMFLQDTYGGWQGDQIVGDFVEYSRVCFENFGDRVKHWFTVNEPIELCSGFNFPAGYFKNFNIPSAHQPYICARNVILAHAEAYRLGKSMIPDSLISFKNNGGYKIPLTNSSADAEAVQRAWDFNEGWFADPIYLTGDFPQTVKDYTSAFLPEFTAEQKATINGSADFFSHDAYTSQFYFAPDAGIAACLANASNPLFPGCYNNSYTYPASLGGWAIGAAADPHVTWLHSATDWVPALLRYLATTWPSAGGIVISEFGFAEPYESQKTALADILTDPVRSAYFRDYLPAVLVALSEGVDVRGLLAWAFVDNLEWSSGFQVRFGLQYVNYTTLERYYKASFFQYVSLFEEYVES
ncbi:hypothetical protein MBLNU459_g0452t1 [Dothideomycetes sp. NU459]